MRGALILLLIATGSSAAAHTGHLGANAGHDHWVAATAMGAAGAVAVLAAVTGKRTKVGRDTEVKKA